MAPFHFSSRIQQRIFFSEKSIDIFEAAPICLNVNMSVHRFESIISALLFTYLPLPYFKDKLFEVRQIIVACNKHMKDVFVTSWVEYLYESISIWTNKFT